MLVTTLPEANQSKQKAPLLLQALQRASSGLFETEWSLQDLRMRLCRWGPPGSLAASMWTTPELHMCMCLTLLLASARTGHRQASSLSTPLACLGAGASEEMLRSSCLPAGLFALTDSAGVGSLASGVGTPWAAFATPSSLGGGLARALSGVIGLTALKGVPLALAGAGCSVSASGCSSMYFAATYLSAVKFTVPSAPHEVTHLLRHRHLLCGHLGDCGVKLCNLHP